MTAAPVIASVGILDPDALETHLAALNSILVQSVAAGAAIGFLQPVAPDAAARFWAGDVLADLRAGRRVLFVAQRGGRAVGTVQLVIAMPKNQPHRCELAKMIVDPACRRQGIGRALVSTALEHARQIGKTLVTLDTRTGDVAETLYRAAGFEVAGVIPDYALDPDGRAAHATTYMYCRL